MSDPVPGRSDAAVVGYRSKWSVVNAAGLAGIWVVCTLVTVVLVPSLLVKAVVLAAAIVAAVPIVRRMNASLTIAADGLVIRSVVGTRVVPWSQTRSVDVGSKRIVGSGSKAYFLCYRTDGDRMPIRSTLVGWGPSGRATMITLLDTAEQQSAGSGVTVSRSDPWNAGTTFPRSSDR